MYGTYKYSTSSWLPKVMVLEYVRPRGQLKYTPGYLGTYLGRWVGP